MAALCFHLHLFISLLYADNIFRRKIFEVPYVHLPFLHSGGLYKDVFWKLAIEQAEVTNGVTLTMCCSVVNSKHADSHHL